MRLMEIMVINSTKEGDVVLDPFCGVGSTLKACQVNHRNYVGIDIEKKYCDEAIKSLTTSVIQYKLF